MSDDLVERVAQVFWETPGKPDDRLRAAIALALEEAAKACDERAAQCEEDDDDDGVSESIVAALRGRAAAFRNLIKKEKR